MKTRGWTQVLEKNMNIPTKNMHFKRKRCGVKWHVLLNSSCRWKKRRVINAILDNIMKGKFEQWWSAIPPILTTRTIISHLLSLYIRYMAVVSFILETAQANTTNSTNFIKWQHKYTPMTHEPVDVIVCSFVNQTQHTSR